MTPEIIPFSPEHLIELSKSTGLIAEKNLDDVLAYGKNIATRGEAYSAVVAGDIIGSAGVFILWPGVAEGWTILTEKMKKYPVFLHREVSKKIPILMKKHGIHRLQVNALFDEPTHDAWVGRLGFLYEGPLYEYDPQKRTYRRYSLLGGN